MSDEVSQEFFFELKFFCEKYGWVMALNEEKDGVSGVIIGKLRYIESVLEEEEDFSEYSVFSPSKDSSGVLQ